MPTYNLERGSVQYRFHHSRAKVQIFGGGLGNGKSTALVMKALRVAEDYPGANILLARATYPKLNDTLRKFFIEWCPPEWIKRMPTKDDNTLYMTNGSVVNFRYIAQRGKQSIDGETTSNLLSAVYDFIGIDQVEDPEITPKDFFDVLGRLRGVATYRPVGDEDPTMPSSGPRWLIVTCNPTHNWVYQELVHPFIIWRDRGIKTDKLMVDSMTGNPIIELFEGPTHMNARNLPEDYIQTQESTLKGQMRERFLLGKWAAFEGLVHPGFSTEENIITKAEALEHLIDCLNRDVRVQAIEGYDFGLTSPSCYILGFIDDLGRVILLDGYYVPDFNYTLQPDQIKKIRSDYVQYLRFDNAIIADPALWKKDVINGTTANQKLSTILSGAPYNLRLTPGANDIISGIAKVNAYIEPSIGVSHIVTGKQPSPMLYVVDDLEFFTDEIFSYYWRKNPQGLRIDDPIDANDHAMNTIKYMLSKLPLPSAIIIPKAKKKPEWLRWHEMENRV